MPTTKKTPLQRQEEQISALEKQLAARKAKEDAAKKAKANEAKIARLKAQLAGKKPAKPAPRKK